MLRVRMSGDRQGGNWLMQVDLKMAVKVCVCFEAFGLYGDILPAETPLALTEVA